MESSVFDKFEVPVRHPLGPLDQARRSLEGEPRTCGHGESCRCQG